MRRLLKLRETKTKQSNERTAKVARDTNVTIKERTAEVMRDTNVTIK